MNSKAIALALALSCSAAAKAQNLQDFSVGYQWSLSGKQYAVAATPLFPDWPRRDLRLAGVIGYELTTGAQPAFGFGLTYRLDRRPVFFEAGAFALFPQSGKPDIALGLQFGVKF